MFDPASRSEHTTTPSIIKQIIIVTVSVAILSALTQSIFELFGLFPGPQNYLSLSWWGLYHWFLWQPLTYLFVQDASGAGVTFFFILKLFLNMYILWVVGGIVYQLIGKWPLLRLYLLGGIGAGLIALLPMKLFGYDEMLAGALPAVLTVATVWAMAMPETEILLFYLIPLKLKWLILYAYGILALMTLSAFDFAEFILYFAAAAIGFCYAVIVHHWRSPFPHTKGIEDFLIRAGDAVRIRLPSWLRFSKNTGGQSEGKVVDIGFSESLKDDDAFVDAMLAKISKRGEESLSWSEKRRLKEISEKKMKDNR